MKGVKQLETGDLRFLPSIVVWLLEFWLLRRVEMVKESRKKRIYRNSFSHIVDRMSPKGSITEHVQLAS